MQNCCVCLGKKFRKFNSNHKLVKCAKCGLVFVNPQPSDSVLQEIYSQGYYDEDYPDWEDERHRKILHQRLESIEEQVGKGKLLDVGCGMGHFLAFARENGWETYGIEISHEGAKRARDKFDLDVFEGTIDEIDFPEEFFDVVCLYDVLEHMRTPRRSLEIIYDLLVSGGLLAITMPNGNSLKATIDGPNWQYYDFQTYKHLWHFGTQSVRELLTSVGFRRICIHTGGSGFPKRWEIERNSIVVEMIRKGWSVFNYLLQKGDLLSGYAVK